MLLLALGAVLLWGLWGFFGKLALNRGMPASSVFLAEVLMGFALGAALLALVIARGAPLPWQAPLNLYGFLSGAALALGLLLFYLALAQGPASLLVPLTAAYPIIAVLLAYALLDEHPSLPQWLGVILVALGTALLLSGRSAGQP
jgi:uncharacterized membrane protein